MKILIPFFAVIALVVIALVGAQASHALFGIWIPYAAVLIFVFGFIFKVLKWGRSPVPFRIPTTAGQMKSFAPWIKQNKLDNPSSSLGVLGRMLLEVLAFRSLFRNTKTQLYPGTKLTYGSEKFLWLGGLAFHWSFLIIFVRHFRFFMQDVPYPIQIVEHLDSFLQIGAPLLYITDVVLLGAVTFLFLRRVMMPQIKYISLPADYFPLLLIFGIGATGVLMRYFAKVPVVSVKELVMGLLTFSPVIPQGISSLFYAHLFLVSTLLAYFPLSKLMHMGGVFLSPTRNMANNNREVRHINPWNYPVHVHTYEEYEDDFREKMKKAGLPVEKE
ncbi:MAG: sulfate reduction electron transfer complex DsrMKJOP subunit DsrM [Nitrospiraceae bacterium]|nr:sulfate reduction electron transfer complex DsrMKJOP subunit DsrM [Nitrospiraceae bacterium]